MATDCPTLQTWEHDVLAEYSDDIATVFSAFLGTDSGIAKLFANGIISKDVHDQLNKEIDCLSGQGNPSSRSKSSVAKDIVSCLIDRSCEKPGIFQDLLLLLETEPSFGDVAQKLKRSQGLHTTLFPQQDVIQSKFVTNVLESYTLCVLGCLASFQSRCITPKSLTNSILCLKLFDYESEYSLVVDRKSDLQKASSNAAIFELVKPYMSFLNPELLAHIVEFLGSDDDRKNFKDFMNVLEDYCKVTQTYFEDQSDEMPFQKVLTIILMETTSMNLKVVDEIRLKMAKSFKLNIAALYINSANGSPLTISFQIPNFACDQLFPLTVDQENEIKALGVISIECEEYSRKFFQCCTNKPDVVIGEYEMEIPSLGRPFDLGMFYDCRKDNLLLGIRICNDDIMKTVIEEHPQVKHSCEVLENDKMETKALSLQLTTPLKLSLMSNLIHDNSKSAKYWNDRCESKREVRICLKYTSTTSKKQLPLHKLGDIQQHVFDRATHVVTGILYGFDAYCVFNHVLGDDERFKDVHDKMLTAVRALSSMETQDHSTSVSVNNCCKVYSDIDNHCTLQKTVDLFRKLPTLSGNEKPTAIPKRIWLYPLNKLDNRCNVLVRHVTPDIVNQLQSIFEYFHNIEMVANDLLNKHSVTLSRFQLTQSKVSKFIEIVTTYRIDIRKKIADLIPRIREGDIEESELN